jgi:hypothetical protein
MSSTTSMPRSPSIDGWDSSCHRHHFPRSPIGQEDRFAHSVSGTATRNFRSSFVELVTVADDDQGGGR